MKLSLLQRMLVCAHRRFVLRDRGRLRWEEAVAIALVLAACGGVFYFMLDVRFFYYCWALFFGICLWFGLFMMLPKPGATASPVMQKMEAAYDSLAAREAEAQAQAEALSLTTAPVDKVKPRARL